MIQKYQIEKKHLMYEALYLFTPSQDQGVIIRWLVHTIMIWNRNYTIHSSSTPLKKNPTLQQRAKRQYALRLGRPFMTNQFPQYKKHLIPLINTKKKKIDYIELLGKKKKVQNSLLYPLLFRIHSIMFHNPTLGTLSISRFHTSFCTADLLGLITKLSQSP